MKSSIEFLSSFARPFRLSAEDMLILACVFTIAFSISHAIVH